MSGGFKWTQRRSQAAQLVADDYLIDEDIAAKVGISSKQLVRWKKRRSAGIRRKRHSTRPS
jgi:hypothetical protein